jgi:hypothetical protein
VSEEKSVAEQVMELRDSWNPAPSDNSLERVVGTRLDEADTRATGHVRAAELDYTDDGEEDDVSDLKGKALDEALDRRGLPKNGSADEKRDRVRAYDEGEYDGEDDDEEE